MGIFNDFNRKIWPKWLFRSRPSILGQAPSFLLALIMLLLNGIPSAAAQGEAQSIDDWAKEAELARRTGLPIMLLFSSDHCPYCVRLKAEVLAPLVQDGELKDNVLLREFNIDTGGKITDFDGERIRSRIFVSRYGIYATPTVFLVDHQGKPLTEPIVGFNDAEAYKDHLDEAIDSAVMSLATARNPRFAHNMKSIHALGQSLD